jgi:hypothetical protein
VFPKYRNLTQLPLYAREARSQLRATDRWAQAIVVDLSWLYLLSVLYAVDETTKFNLGQLGSALRQVTVGGEHEVRERDQLKVQIRRLVEHFEPEPGRRPAEPDLVPSFFEDLTDLVARASRRRQHATEALRVLEFTGVETILGRGSSWKESFPSYDAYAVKLASDTVRFLCRAAELDMRFLDIFDRTVEGERRPDKNVRALPGAPVEQTLDPGMRDAGNAALEAEDLALIVREGEEAAAVPSGPPLDAEQASLFGGGDGGTPGE